MREKKPTLMDLEQKNKTRLMLQVGTKTLHLVTNILSFASVTKVKARTMHWRSRISLDAMYLLQKKFQITSAQTNIVQFTGEMILGRLIASQT